MVLSLLFNRKYAQSNVGGIFLDATLTEDHQYNSRVTNYPVEDGRIISDHIINDPETVQITGIVTDTPLAILSSFNRSIAAFNRLIEIHRNRERITVVTGIKVYTDMVMTGLQVPRNVATGQSLTFVIDLQKIYLDSSVRFTENPNDPLNKPADKIPREIVAETNKYPTMQNDPPTTLKDQAQSAVNVGIQDLIPIPAKILPNIYLQVEKLRGIV
jgi:hypothetical protein